MFQAALRHHDNGRIDEAVTLYKRILTLKPGSADAHNNLGSALEALDRIDEAVVHFQRALVLDAGHATAHNNLGVALVKQGRIDEAVAHYERALILKPDYAAAHNNLGVALEKQGKIDEALKHYESALVLKPDYEDAHNNLGIALAQQGRIDEALKHYERVLALNPEHANARNNLAAALLEQGNFDEAVKHYERALVLNPGYADVYNNLGAALVRYGRIDDAITHYRRALAIDPDDAAVHNNLGSVLKDNGSFDDAMAHYERAIAIRPDYMEAHFNRAELKTFHHDHADVKALEALAARDDMPAEKTPFLHFAVAKALEDCGDYPRAFEHLRKGNDLKRRQIDYDEPGLIELFQRIATGFDRGVFNRFEREGNPSSLPIFVLGMPRSGSTLIEQILASHPQIHGAGELEDLKIAARTVINAGGRHVSYPECVPAPDGVLLRRIGESYLARLPALANGKIRIIDKMPGNFLSVGLIRMILPNARIIHTMRDPIDTCVSCYSKLFAVGHNFTYDLAELGRYYRCYRELMTHWRAELPPDAMLDVSYEDVVDDLERQARRLIDYCGLPWDDRCLSFHKTSRPVRTASAVQVRQPLFRSSLQRWRRYEAGLAPLLKALGDIVPEHSHAMAGG